MCLAIPGQVIELVDEVNQIAKVDVVGVRRNINVSLLASDGDEARPGDWVLIHVGFALSKVDEEEAHATLALAAGHGPRLRAGARGAEGERDRMTARPAVARPATRHCITCSDEGIEMTVVELTQCGAQCRDPGGIDQRVEIELVEPVEIGDTCCSSTPASRSRTCPARPPQPAVLS